jgi:hypothetical protein
MANGSETGVRRAGQARARVAIFLGVGALLGGCGPKLVEITSGFDIDPDVRPALTEDGKVVAAEPQRLLIGDGSPISTVDLAPFGLTVSATVPAHAVDARAAGDIVFVADNSSASGCPSSARGAYRIAAGGGAVTTLYELCVPMSTLGEVVGHEIALSPNGTVAFSSIRNGAGAIRRGPVTGPVSVFRSGTGEFFNTQELDVNDAGTVATEMEYSDGFAGGLMRGVLVFDAVEQAKADMDTAVEKLGIGQQPRLAINASGQVAVSSSGDINMNIGGTIYSYPSGVYIATPTLFNTPKVLTLVADLSGPYCKFGAVDINSAGAVAFEAALDGNPTCTGAGFDGIFTGPDPRVSTVVVRGDGDLRGHQYFDNVVLGHINDSLKVAFLTTYSEPLVDPVKVWRTN